MSNRPPRAVRIAAAILTVILSIFVGPPVAKSVLAALLRPRVLKGYAFTVPTVTGDFSTVGPYYDMKTCDGWRSVAAGLQEDPTPCKAV